MISISRDNLIGDIAFSPNNNLRQVIQTMAEQIQVQIEDFAGFNSVQLFMTIIYHFPC